MARPAADFWNDGEEPALFPGMNTRETALLDYSEEVVSTHSSDTTSVHGIANTSALMVDGDAAGGVLAGTYPNPSFAADMATQAELDAHVSDSSAAHAASAISFSATGTIAGTDAQTAIAEVATDAAAALTAHTGDATDAHAASAIGFTPTGTIAATTAQAAIAEVASEAASALTAHTTDTTDAHAASAISFSPTGTIAATTVQAAIAEVASEAGGGGGGGTPDDESVTLAKLADSLLVNLKGTVVDTGSGYSSRPAGFASVEWVGPEDPDTLAEDGDTWVPTEAP